MNALYKHIDPVGRDYMVIKNSEVVKVQDWITNESAGVANVDAATEKIFGLVTAVVDSDRVSLEATGADTGALGGTWASATKKYTAASDNQTVDGVLAEFIPVKEGMQFIAKLDADKGTTTGSNKKGYFLSVLTSDSSLLDESTASATIASTQFVIVDPYLNGPDDEVIVECIARGTDQYSVDT